MSPADPILLCTDMDRTIIPNGLWPESPDARPLFRRLAGHPDIVLAYVTGRDTELIARALKNWSLPLPRIAVGDVGTSIYDVAGTMENPEFSPWPEWEEEIAKDWSGRSGEEIATILSDEKVLRPQEPEKQKKFKQSYYAPPDTDLEALSETLRQRLADNKLIASVVTSIDEMADTALVDVIPARATKAHAVRFIMERQGIDVSRVIYAGDSGNDLPALTAGFKAILVGNAADDIRRQAREAVSRKNREICLYEAGGGFLEMNGNYSAGVIEGLVHFVPEIREWIVKGDSGKAVNAKSNNGSRQ